MSDEHTVTPVDGFIVIITVCILNYIIHILRVGVGEDNVTLIFKFPFCALDVSCKAKNTMCPGRNKGFSELSGGFSSYSGFRSTSLHLSELQLFHL